MTTRFVAVLAVTLATVMTVTPPARADNIHLGPLQQAPSAATTYTAGTNLPPRIQWEANYGYCGEVSFISAGLYYGQYLSQYDARAAASGNTPQNRRNSQLLLGVNDTTAAAAMHLAATQFTASSATTATAFLTWVKTNVVAGYPVVIGVLMNQNRFNGTASPNAGDSDYDHIVPVTLITSTHSLSSPVTAYSDDALTLNDGGVWTGTPNKQPQNVFTYPFSTFPATRQAANSPSAGLYSIKTNGNTGTAITGVIDQSHETVPVRLTTSVPTENPQMAEGSTARPTPSAVTLTITVSGLKPGTSYNLYRYTTLASVPNATFNANAAKAAQKFTITITSGSSYTTTQTIKSNEVAVYRAVPAAAP